MNSTVMIVLHLLSTLSRFHCNQSMSINLKLQKKSQEWQKGAFHLRDAPLSPGARTPISLQDRQRYGLFVGRRLPEQKADAVNACNPYQGVNDPAA